MSRRSRSRAVALQILFQDDLNPCDPPADAEPFLNQRLQADDLICFSRDLVQGVREHRNDLDGILEPLAEHWSLSRMATADRNILRLAAFEMLYLRTPYQIAIDEGIELAKRFGTAQSSQFINGILDRVWQENAHRSESGKQVSGEPNSVQDAACEIADPEVQSDTDLSG